MEKKCKELIKEHFKGRLEDFRLFLNVTEKDVVFSVDKKTGENVLSVNGNCYEKRFPKEKIENQNAFIKENFDSIREMMQDAFCEYGLSFDYVTPGTFGENQRQGYFRYQLSYGGPSDEFRFFVNPDFSLIWIEYHFMNWYDGAKLSFFKGKNFDFLKQVYDQFNETETTKFEFEKAMSEK